MINVPANNTQKVLDEFFVNDGGLTPSGHVRNSTLLQCKKDLRYLRLIDLNNEELGLSETQIEYLSKKIPTLATVLVYCAAIDLLARVMKKDLPKGANSKKFFTWSAQRWFNQTQTQSGALWKLRCGMSHQYKVEVGTRAIPHGFTGSSRFIRSENKWEFNLNGMYSELIRAIEKSHSYISRLNPKTQREYANFIYEHGFFYSSTN